MTTTGSFSVVYAILNLPPSFPAVFFVAAPLSFPAFRESLCTRPSAECSAFLHSLSACVSSDGTLPRIRPMISLIKSKMRLASPRSSFAMRCTVCSSENSISAYAAVISSAISCSDRFREAYRARTSSAVCECESANASSRA